MPTITIKLPRRLTLDYEFSSFDCDDDDLKEFLMNDAKAHLQTFFAVTYIFEHENKIIAYYSVLNDKIAKEEMKGHCNSKWRKIPHKKRIYNSYPAVKIGRLAVATEYRSQGIGTQIVDYIKMDFIDSNKTGCRFLTVDAYNNPKTIQFYERNGFQLLSNEGETILMFYDLNETAKEFKKFHSQ